MTQLTADDVGGYATVTDQGEILMDYRVVPTNVSTTGCPLPEVKYVVEYKSYTGVWVFSGANFEDPAAFVNRLVKV